MGKKKQKALLENGELSLTAISALAPYLEIGNAKEILPQVVNKSVKAIEKVLDKKFPERTKKREFFTVEMTDELRVLLENARRIGSEKDPLRLLIKMATHFVREKRPRACVVKRHTRYVPKAISKEVRERDGYQCTFVSPKGIRCSQTAHLQDDHVQPWALGGSSHDKGNIRSLCRAHNLFKARQDFPRWQRPDTPPKAPDVIANR
ncbi:MAG: hypothetical protein HYR96_03895 [Deltaproteobacteria bacterium]|nr:hypothetical protein [Deltaproteobacteria bacterium]MBI3296129.1 hypothetical protein [Deltaproteobacteria bacterium]